MEKGIHERGIERDGAAVAEAITRGLAVVEGELGEWVDDLPASSYDLVVLNQVLPLMEDPVAVIEAALRVGRRSRRCEFRALADSPDARPRRPSAGQPALPYQWLTPNIGW
jgi:hypothetical protein